MRTALCCSLMLLPMLTAGLPAQAQSSGTGVGLVQLGQHSVDEIKDRQRQIKAELNHHELAKVDRKTLKAEWRRLDTESQGNVIIGAYRRRLDSVG